MLFKAKRELIAEVERLKSENVELVRKGENDAANVTEGAEIAVEAARLMEEAKKELVEAKAEITKLKKMVREQSEADLLINALKAVGMIKDSGGTDYQQEAGRLERQREAAKQRAFQGNGLGACGQAGYNTSSCSHRWPPGY
jgi:hypothetical protein